MRRFASLLSLVCLLWGSGKALATPLDPEECAKLKTELAVLEAAGIRAQMAKGAAWAKANLSSDKLEQVQRLIQVDEQLTFRCHGKPLVLLPADTELESGGPPGDKGETEEKGKAGETAGAAKNSKGNARPTKLEGIAKKAAAAKAEPKATDAAKAEKKKSASAAKSKPKAKTNDAYQPAPSDPDKPFESQLGPAPKATPGK